MEEVSERARRACGAQNGGRVDVLCYEGAERRVGVTDRINGSKKSLTLAQILGSFARLSNLQIVVARP